MNSIFDQNSEFLKYVNKSSDAPKNPEPSKINSESLENSQATPPDSYVLDLKSHSLRTPSPIEEVPIKKTVQQANPSTTTKTPNPENSVISAHQAKKIEKKLNKVNTFFGDQLKFILVSGLIFVITFVAINWSAYSKVFYNWYLDLTNQSLNTPLVQFSQQNPDLALSTEAELVNNTDIPKLNLEVTPPGTRVIIPRLQSNVPVISMSTNTLVSRNWDALEREIQDALRSGVVHYPGTPFPNQSGNVVLTGHSSYYPWDPGRFKDVFAILHQAVIGDEIIVFYNQKKYTYQITDIKKVLPTQVDVLGDTGDNRLTLITCTPIGTNLQRLIVTAKPISKT